MQVSDEIIKVLDYLCEKVGVTIDWTNANVLPYLEQLCTKFIRWEIATSIAWLVIGVILGVIGCSLIKIAKKYWSIHLEKVEKSRYDEFYSTISIVYYTIAGFLILTAIIITPVQIFDIIECYTFPEKAIYDYIQTMLHSTN